MHTSVGHRGEEVQCRSKYLQASIGISGAVRADQGAHFALGYSTLAATHLLASSKFPFPFSASLWHEPAHQSQLPPDPALPHQATCALCNGVCVCACARHCVFHVGGAKPLAFGPLIVCPLSVSVAHSTEY